MNRILPQKLVERARAFSRNGDVDAAAALCAEHRDVFGSRLKWSQFAARLSLRAKQFAQALEFADAAERHDPNDTGTIALRVKILWGLGRPAEITKFIDGLPDDISVTDARAAGLIADAYLLEGRGAEAIAVCRKALVSTSPSERLIKTFFRALSEESPAQDIEDVVTREVFEVGQAPEYLHGVPAALLTGNLRPDAFARIYEQAKARWPDSPALPLLARRLPTPEASTLKGTALDRAKQKIAHLAKEHSELAEVSRAFATLEEASLTRELVGDNEEATFLTSPKAPTDRVFVQFAGLANNYGRNDMHDAYYSAMGAASIFIKDADRLLCLNGIPFLGDSFEATVVRLRAEIDALHPKARVTLVGPSAGGIGALTYAGALNAERVICLSAPTTIDVDFLNEIGDRRGRVVLHRLLKHIPKDRMRMRDVIEADEFTGQIDMIYGEDHAIDRAHAEQMRGLPNVSMYPVAGLAGHSTIMRSIETRAFADILSGNMTAVRKMDVVENGARTPEAVAI